MSDDIAVIISTYRSPEMLRLVLHGYQQQTDRNFKIYIADDGSSDETREMIKAFRRISSLSVAHIWHKDHGFRKARILNKTIVQSREDYVLFTDGDCIPLSGLIAAHRSIAQRHCFASGSRVLLNEGLSRRLQAVQSADIRAEMHVTAARLLSWRCSGQINRLLPLFLPVHASSPHEKLAGIRGCHLACWRSDLVTVNGFDEAYEGWGREDSDLTARLLHAGIRRIDLRGVPVLHLWHKEESRHRLQKNDDMLRQCLNSKRIRAVTGLGELPAP